MIKVIKTDGKNHYFIDKDTDEYVDRYDPEVKNLALITKMDNGSILKVSKKEIKTDIGNQLHFQYGSDKFIIDDGYQNRLIRAGYLILNDYDKEQILDKNKGVETRKKIINQIKSTINTLCENQSNVTLEVLNGNEMIVKYKVNGFLYTVCIDTINGIVNKNQQRKFYELPFYPFLKQMDKYGTIYVSIFCKKEEEFNMDFDQYDAGENFLIKLINDLNQNSKESSSYKFTRVVVKRRINYSKGI